MLFCFVSFVLILSFVSSQSRSSLHTTGSATIVNEFLENTARTSDESHSIALETGLQMSSGRIDRGPLDKMCLASR